MKRLQEFKCAQCETVFERRVRDVRNQAEYCPNCGGEAFKRITAPAVHFHGDGFTKTARK